MAADDSGLTMKELLMEVRKDVKELVFAMPGKVDRAELAAVIVRIEAVERILAGKNDVETFKKWIVGLAFTATLTVLGLIGSVVLRFIPLHKP